jgi:hypothetical protein
VEHELRLKLGRKLPVEVLGQARDELLTVVYV